MIKLLYKELNYIKNMQQLLFEKKDTGIEMSFMLFIPNDINNESTLILNGTTPGVGTKDAHERDEIEKTKTYGTYLDSYKEALQVAIYNYYPSVFKKLAVNYNNPMLIPIIPRCNGLYTGFLGYEVYHENYERAIEAYDIGWSNFTKEDLEKFKSLDIQITNMIYYAIDYINEKYTHFLREIRVLACNMPTHFISIPIMYLIFGIDR